MSGIVVAPGATFEAWALLPTGTTPGVRIRDGQGADHTARTTTGVVEDIASSGLWRKPDMVAPTTAGDYLLVWDDGAGLYATETLRVSYSAAGAGIPAANEYVTVDQLKATLEIADADDYADDDITVAVEAASRLVDAHCGRRFYADDDANQVRYYTPHDSGLVVIDDLVTLTTLATDPAGWDTWEVTWASTDYRLRPRNRELYDGTNPTPYLSIRTATAGRYAFPHRYEDSVRVTGKFGWPSVPAMVTEATTIMAGRLLKRARETPYGVAGMGMDGAAVRLAKTDPDVAAMLRHLVRSQGFR